MGQPPGEGVPPGARGAKRHEAPTAHFRPAGIPVRADATLALMAGVLFLSFWLRFETVTARVPAVAMAVVATALFLGSVLVHELAHALEARRRGLQVEGITLYLFGGATRVTTEVRRPADEFAMTVVGPWASIVLGCGFALVAYGTARGGVATVAEVAGELGWLNVILGLFNLLPGAPLDGGRLLEAVVWRASGDRGLAARASTGAGRLIGWLIAALGVSQMFFVAGGFLGGFWFVLIGLFLARSASAESRAVALRARLSGRSVRELITPVAMVPLGASVEDAATACMGSYRSDAALVTGPGGVVGVLECASVEGLSPDARRRLRAEDVMTPVASLRSVQQDAPASDLLRLLGAHPVVVLDGGSVYSVITAEQFASVLRWLAPTPVPVEGQAVASGPWPTRPSLRPLERLGRLIALLTSAGVVAAAASIVPVPVYEIAPGVALDLPPLIQTSGPAHPVKGSLLLTSVQLSSPSAVQVVQTLFSEHRDLLWQSTLVPSGMNADDYDQWQRQVFRDSVQLASAVALRQAGYPVRLEGGGAVVTAVETGGPSDGKLLPGDTVTAVGASKVATASDLLAQISRAEPGFPVVLQVERGDQNLRATVWPGEPNALGRPILGIAVQDAPRSIQLPFKVQLALSDVGGPSAGLMTALSVYAVTTGSDLTRGRTVAGTGTIDAEGRVGPVGGVAQKVAGAAREGASIFLVPASEAATARSAARGTRLQVIAVDTFGQALARLTSHSAPRS